MLFNTPIGVKIKKEVRSINYQICWILCCDFL